MAVVMSVLIVILLTVIAIIFTLWMIVKKRDQAISPFKSDDDDEVESASVHNDYYDPTTTSSDKLPNISRESITYISDLGEGNFGMVIKGEAKGIVPSQSSTIVAIKVLKENSNHDAITNFVHEAVLMNQFDHPNILKLLGVCFDEEPFCMIFEYMELGDLNMYLRSTAVSGNRLSLTLTIQQLVGMAINVAAGLEYLSTRRFVHRDLATRNCLINSQLFVKIADFGLSKDVYSTDYYRLGQKSLLPIRWMPPEAIVYFKFTIQSDVWSLGIVLWEIFSGGAQPYCALSNEEVVKYVTEEKMLPCPNGCPGELYDIMIGCWKMDPEKRLTASEVLTGLQNWSSSNAIPTQPEGYMLMKSPDSYVIMKPAPSPRDASQDQSQESTV